MSTAETRRCIRCNAEVTAGKMFYREQEGDFCIGPYCATCFEQRPVYIPAPERRCVTCGKDLECIGAVQTSKDGKTIVLECWDCWNSEAEAQDPAKRLATATALLKELVDIENPLVRMHRDDAEKQCEPCGGWELYHFTEWIITRAEAFLKEAGA